MLFTYMIMIIDEIITFITSSKLLLQLCDIYFNHGLIFEAFSLLLISYRSLNPFRLYQAYTLYLIFLRRKIYMSYFGSMSLLSVIFHMNICITTHIAVNLWTLLKNLFYD